MITKKDAIFHLNILKVPVDVDFTIEDVQQAYRYLANLYHPDKNKTTSANEKMTQINASYNWVIENIDEIKKLDLSSQESADSQSDAEKLLKEKLELKHNLEQVLKITPLIDADDKVKKSITLRVKAFIVLVENTKTLEQLEQIEDEIYDYLDKKSKYFAEDDDDDDFDDDDFDDDDDDESFEKNIDSEAGNKSSEGANIVGFLIVLAVIIGILYGGFLGIRAIVRAIGNLNLFEPKYNLELDLWGGYFFDDDDQVFSYNKRYAEGETVALPSEVYVGNYVFFGWDIDYNCENPVFSVTIPADDMLYNACFIGETQSVTINNIEEIKIIDIEGDNVIGDNGEYYNLNLFAKDEFYLEEPTFLPYSQTTLNPEYYPSSIPSYLSEFSSTLSSGEVITVYDQNVDNSHYVVWTSNNRLLSVGSNIYGQLGDGTYIDRNTPIDITDQIDFQAGETVIDIDCGWWHTILLTSNGRVFTWGDNYQGQLGIDGSFYGSISSPTEITSEIPLSLGEKIIFIEVNTHANILLSSLGNIYIFGNDNNFFFNTNTSSSTLRHPYLVDDSLSNELNSGETIEYIHVYSQSLTIQTDQNRVLNWNFNSDGFVVNDITLLLGVTSTNKILKSFYDLVLMENGDLYVVYFNRTGSYSYPAVKKLNIYGLVGSSIVEIAYNENITEVIRNREGYEFVGISQSQFGYYEDKVYNIYYDQELYIKWINND